MEQFHSWNEKNLLVEKNVMIEENGKPPVEVVENILEKEKVKNELLSKIRKTNLGIREIHVLQLILQNFEDRMAFKYDSSSENSTNENPKIPTEGKELVQTPKKLNNDSYSIQLPTFICQPDLDIKQDSESDRTGMDEENEKIQKENKEPKYTSEEMEKLNEVDSNSAVISANTNSVNLSELVPPYNCKEDGFLSCSFKTLYFDEYLKHVEAIHQVDGFDSFSFDHKLEKEAVMEGWLVKEVGPFQCRYCKKATVTHEEMRRHQMVFHTQEECFFYYRKFVPNETVITPEQVNLEDPSFINHVIHLPDQIHLCNFKLSDEEPEVSVPVLPTKTGTPKEDGVQNDACECKWKDCNLTFVSRTTLAKHIEKNHIRLQRGVEFICFWINCRKKMKPFSTKQHLSRHMCIHSGEKAYKCSRCDKAFSQLESVRIHQRNHTGEKPYLCQFSNCCKRFTCSSDRVKHHKKYHDTETLDEQLKKVKSLKKKEIIVLSNSSNCKWKDCCQTSESKTDLVKHIEKSHVQLQNGKKFTCFWSDCSRKLKPYNKRAYLLIHMRIHTGEKPHKCPFQGCNKAFTKSWCLRIHQRSGHPGERPYVCQFSNCSKSFTNNYDRDYHQWSHYDTDAFVCQVTGCSRKYSVLSYFQRHMKTHTIYEQLNVKTVQQKESDFVSSETKQQRVDCDTLQCKWESCYQTYNSQTALVRHLEENHVHFQRHRKFTCFWTNCPRKSKPYASKQNLLIHMRIHSGAKPYKCAFQDCKKEFLTSWTLEVHQRNHTGEKPDMCQLSNGSESCTLYNTEDDASQMADWSKIYTKPNSLSKHMENHTVDEELEVEQKEDNFIIYHL